MAGCMRGRGVEYILVYQKFLITMKHVCPQLHVDQDDLFLSYKNIHRVLIMASEYHPGKTREKFKSKCSHIKQNT